MKKFKFLFLLSTFLMFGTIELDAQFFTGSLGSSGILKDLPTGYVRMFVGNNERLNVKGGLAISQVNDGAQSALWIIKPIRYTTNFRIENKNGQALYHTLEPNSSSTGEHNVLFGNIDINDPRAQWKIRSGSSPNTFEFANVNPSNLASGRLAPGSDRKLKLSFSSSATTIWELSMRVAPRMLTQTIGGKVRTYAIPTPNQACRIESKTISMFGTMPKPKRLNVEGGLALSEIHDGAWSAMWYLKPIPGSKYYRIENKWKKDGHALNMKNGTLQFSAISIGDSNGQWELEFGTKFKSKSGFILYSTNGNLNIFDSKTAKPYGAITDWILKEI